MKKLLIAIFLLSSLFAREYIAIIDFEGIGISENEARVLTQRLTSEMISLELYQVLERSEMKRLLSEQKFQYSGCVDTKCAVELGKMLGAKYMVVVTISKLGKTFTLDSRLISVETSEAYGSGQYSTDVSIDNLIKYGMKSLAYQLCALDPPTISISKKITDTLYDNRYIVGGIAFLLWLGWGLLPA